MPDPLDVLQACRRSRIKFRVYQVLLERSPVLPGELADAADTTPDRVFGVLHGDGQRFRHDTALVALGVVRPMNTRRGVAYEVTEGGRRVGPFVAERLRRRS